MLKLVEIVDGSWANRRIIETRDMDAAIDLDQTWYRSMFAIHSEETNPHDVSAFFESGTKEGDLVFDFDHEHDIQKAQDDCKRVISYLRKSLGVPEEALTCHFSGKKGYHLAVDMGATGLGPRPDLHRLYRKFAKSIHETYAPTLDAKIYNARRLLRIPGTVHQDTGFRKVRVDLETLTGNPLPLRPEGHYQGGVAVQLKDALLRIETAQADSLEKQGRLPVEFRNRYLDCIRTALEDGLPDGVKNDGTYTVALYLMGIGMNRHEAERAIAQSAICNVSGLEQAELRKILTSAYKGDKRFGLKDSVLEDYITEEDVRRWKLAKVDDSYVGLTDVCADFLREVKTRKGTCAKYFVDGLDSRLGGMNGGELVLIGAYTGTGKSEFAYSVCYRNALAGTPTAFITLEVSNEDFVSRMVRGKLGIDQARFWSGELTREEIRAIETEVLKIQAKQLPLFFRKRKSFMSIDELERLVSSLIVEQQCRLIVIDHLHYMGDRQKYSKDNEHVAASIRAIRNLAVRYNVAIMVVAHFKKQPDDAHKPSLHDFRDSSAIEQEAATAILIWRNLNGLNGQQQRTEFHIAKNRKDVPLCTVGATFDPATRGYATEKVRLKPLHQ